MATETFNASDTWTCPAGVSSATVECWGSGGNGGNGYAGTTGSGGGGGGAYASSVVAVTPLQDYDIVIAVGSPTTFDAGVVSAEHGSDGVDDLGGDGGLAANSVGDVTRSGGDGADNAGGGGGCGGGSSASESAAGNPGSAESGNTGGAGGSPPAGTAGEGGDGGTGAVATAARDGEAGSAPGGGGGGCGGSGSGTGGAGAIGRVVITYVVMDNPPSIETSILSMDVSFQSMGEAVGYFCRSALSWIAGLLYAPRRTAAGANRKCPPIPSSGRGAMSPETPACTL